MQGDAAVPATKREHAAILLARSDRPAPHLESEPVVDALSCFSSDLDLDARLSARLSVGPADETEFLGFGHAAGRHGRPCRCGWHLVLHRAGGHVWTHLYRVVADAHGVLVLLHRAGEGDRREAERERLHRPAGAALGIGASVC